MNAVPIGRPFSSSNAPSDTMKSPPGKSPTPVLVRGTWKSGCPGMSDFGRPTACVMSAKRNMSLRLRSNRRSHDAPGASHGSSPDGSGGGPLTTKSRRNWKPVFHPTVPG